MTNKDGFPTNAIYGFINMINKIIKEEMPEYMMIAFDKGKTFRHEKYKDYKDGRKETPNELKLQFPEAKKICLAMGIPYIEIDNYEADDIIGTYAKEVDINDDFIATIISSDKDLLQLISFDVDVKLLKSNDHIMMNQTTFFEEYGITPEKMVDLKALMGDSSDNIPGVKGIGEKTALDLLKKYGTLDGIYENIDSITGKTKEKLVDDKENAYFSYELATIYKDVPCDVDLDKIKYQGITKEYINLLEKYEFYSIIKKLDLRKIDDQKEHDEVIIVNDLDEIPFASEVFLHLEVNGNYHDKDILGIAIYTNDKGYFVKKEHIRNHKLFTDFKVYTYDLKKLLVTLMYLNISFGKNFEDLMIAQYILNYKSNLGEIFKETKVSKEEKSIDQIAHEQVRKTLMIKNNKDQIFSLLDEIVSKSLYYDLEIPLTYVLADMEYTGVCVSKDILDNMKEEIAIKLELLSIDIFNLAGEEFNILSPKQLGNILFVKLAIPYPKKMKRDSFSTNSDVLNKLIDYPIIKKVLDYRTLAKLYSSYAVGLVNFIHEDDKIHTIFNQTLTRTGRLSSNNPNLQNIPIREEYGRKIRKAFIPSQGHIILSSDYSQIELRIFSHMAEVENLIEAFKNGMDIHTKTAMDIFKVPEIAVTSEMRRTAKAVNFGILYGISSFGLSEDLGINMVEAKKFINDYLETYPKIKTYMENIIKQAHENGYVLTLFGRKRIIEELNNSNYMVRQMGERMALNTPIQGTSADILKKAMIELYDHFNKLNLKSKMIIQVHDELLFDVHEDEIEIVTKLVKDIMENTYTLSVPIKAVVNEGKSWYEAK